MRSGSYAAGSQMESSVLIRKVACDCTPGTSRPFLGSLGPTDLYDSFEAQMLPLRVWGGGRRQKKRPSFLPQNPPPVPEPTSGPGMSTRGLPVERVVLPSLVLARHSTRGLPSAPGT